MKRAPSSLLALLSLSTSACSLHIPTDEVPLLGPSFLSNFDLSKSRHIQDASEKLPQVIEDLFGDGSLNKTDLIFSVDVFSAATNESLCQYTHVGEGLEDLITAGVLSDNTIGRFGSVTKLITVYALIAEKGYEILHKPVTEFLPELSPKSEGPLRHIDWEDVTIGALASHQAGSGGMGGWFCPYSLLKNLSSGELADIVNSIHTRTSFERKRRSLRRM